MKRLLVLCLVLMVLIISCKKDSTDNTKIVNPDEDSSTKMIEDTQPQKEPMIIDYGYSVKEKEDEAVKEAVDMLKKGFIDKTPKLVIVFSIGTIYDEKKVFENLAKHFNLSETRLWGMATPPRGLFVPDGKHMGISLMGLYAPEMKVGLGHTQLTNVQDPSTYADAGKEAITQAINDAGMTGQRPPDVILFASLNLVTDTKIFRGVETVTGKDVPIIGGNSIGEDLWQVGGGWTYGSQGAHEGFISVAPIWLDRKIGVAYGYGYKKTEFKGVATKSDFENRVLYEIDGRPAADVYNEWIGGKITDLIAQGGGPISFEIFAMSPFSKPVNDNEADSVMIAPLALNPDKSIFMTHEGIEEGKTISVYEMDPDDIIVKPAVVATLAMARGRISADEVAGSLMLYCDAPFLTFKGESEQMVDHFYKRIGNKPFLGFFASGEAGYSPQGGNRCLAYSTVVLIFGKN